VALSKLGSIACINIDAHLDVRKPSPVPSSGSPFYLAIEEGLLNKKNFIEFGIQDHCNAPELWEYIKAKEISVVPFSTLRSANAVKKFKTALDKLSTSHDQVIISFDLDSVACAFAPGVSAPQSEGFTPSEIIEMMEISGSNKKVCSLGIFELNPLHDVEKSTARLAATAAYHFIEEALEV
jgi:formiminoglutamase